MLFSKHRPASCTIMYDRQERSGLNILQNNLPILELFLELAESDSLFAMFI